MDYNVIIIRFGEMNTKGKNKKDFIKVLFSSIERALIEFKDEINLISSYDHIYIYLNNEQTKNNMEIIGILKNIPGLYSFSLALKIDADLDNIKDNCLNEIKKEEGKTFKIYTHRIDKSYPFISDEINREIAGKILRNTNLKVDVHNPDILLSVEIRSDGAYLFTQTIKGVGGYPKGSLGKGLMMLSGGIDSPVASYLLLKRGVDLSFIHFSSPPYTNIGVINKLTDILKRFSIYQKTIYLHIIPFTKLQEAIYDATSVGYPITIMRRMMYRIASLIAKKYHLLIIANGESLGQVASQTLESINVINEVTNVPIIRPLATYDKNDVIEIAKKIETYEISIRPYQDCCTIFPVIKPKTNPHLDVVRSIEEKIDYENLIKEAIDNETIMVIKGDEVKEYKKNENV